MRDSLVSKVIGLQLATLFEKRLRLRCFPVNFAKFLLRFTLGMSVFPNLNVVKFLSYHGRMKKIAYKSIHTKERTKQHTRILIQKLKTVYIKVNAR